VGRVKPAHGGATRCGQGGSLSYTKGRCEVSGNETERNRSARAERNDLDRPESRSAHYAHFLMSMGRLVTGSISLLSRAWPYLQGATGSTMGSWAPDQIEDPTWHPPILRFQIGHSAMAPDGSTKEEVQHWEVDLDLRTASIVGGGRGQVHRPAPKFDVWPASWPRLCRPKRMMIALLGSIATSC
jgi:hypothetical protein